MNDILEDEQQSQYRVTAGELKQFVERYERLEAERRDLADQMKEVLAEARARGYDVKVLRKLIALRRRDLPSLRGGGDPRTVQAGFGNGLSAPYIHGVQKLTHFDPENGSNAGLRQTRYITW